MAKRNKLHFLKKDKNETMLDVADKCFQGTRKYNYQEKVEIIILKKMYHFKFQELKEAAFRCAKSVGRLSYVFSPSNNTRKENQVK